MPLQAKQFWSENKKGHLGGQAMFTTQTNNKRWTLAFRQIPIQDDRPRGANHLRSDMCKANL